MIAKLPDDLVRALEQAGDKPLPVENPHNHKRYVIVAEECLPRPEDATPSEAGGEWTEAKNRRRFFLIDKNIARTITAEEHEELQRLQQEVGDYLNRVAPLPIAESKAILEQLQSTIARGN